MAMESKVFYQESERERIQLLAEQMRETFDPSHYSTLGHGTSVETAQKILEEGLEAVTNNLDETVVPLFDSSKSYEEQDDTFRKILQWPHRFASAVVVIMIPNPREDQGGGHHYFNSVFKEKDEEYTRSNPEARNFLVPPEFIKGYVDVHSSKFIPNDLYDSSVEVVVKPRGRVIFPKVVIPSGELLNPKNEISGDDEIDIW